MILQLLVNNNIDVTNVNMNIKGSLTVKVISTSKIKYNCILKAGGIYSLTNPIAS